MGMKVALQDRLAGAPAVAALAGPRVSWDDRPGALPAVTLTLVSAGRGYTHGGPDGLDEPRVQVDCWAASKHEREALAAAVRTTLEAADAAHGWVFHFAFVEGALTTREDDGPGGQPVFRETLDFMIPNEELPG